MGYGDDELSLVLPCQVCNGLTSEGSTWSCLVPVDNRLLRCQDPIWSPARRRSGGSDSRFLTSPTLVLGDDHRVRGYRRCVSRFDRGRRRHVDCLRGLRQIQTDRGPRTWVNYTSLVGPYEPNNFTRLQRTPLATLQRGRLTGTPEEVACFAAFDGREPLTLRRHT